MKKIIAQKLKELRKKSGLSADNVSAELKQKYKVELSPKTLYGYENGVSQPNADVFVFLCLIYGVSDFNIFLNDNINTNSLKSYDKLNTAGKQKAAEYITDLSENPRYTAENDIAEDIVKELKQIAEASTVPTAPSAMQTPTPHIKQR